MRWATIAVSGLSAVIAGCQTNPRSGFIDGDPYVPSAGSVEGRVCAPDGREWLADAMVYINIYGSDGQVTEVQVAYTDRYGYFLLEDLAPHREYTVYIQHASEVLDEIDVWVGDGEAVVLEEPSCLDPLSMSIALVTGSYDDVHLVLQNIGFANYDLVDGEDVDQLRDFLLDPDNLARYDIVFFNGGHVEGEVFYSSTGSGVPGFVLENLRDYVATGGSVYASDWSYDVIERAWPDAVDFLGDDSVPDAAQKGETGLVSAQVTDFALSQYLSSTEVVIEYDLPVWPPITAVEEHVNTLLAGTVHYREGTSTYSLESAPLLVEFSSGEGRVAFATFRVAANNGADMVALLLYMMHELN